MPSKPKHPEHVRVATYLPPTTYHALRLACAQQRKPGEQLIREAVAQFLGVVEDGGGGR